MVYSIGTTADNTTVDGICTLREALAAARANLAVDGCAAGEADDRIELAAGTYVLNLGPETIATGGALEIRSVALDPSQVTLDLAGSGNFLSLTGSGPYTLRGLTITAGSGVTGGAIYAHEVDLELREMSFLANYASSSGGALYFGSGTLSPDLTIDNSNFTTNIADGQGGGIDLQLGGTSVADLRDILFHENHSHEFGAGSAGRGGGLNALASQSATIRLARLTFGGNRAVGSSGATAEGGAVSCETTDDATLTGFDLVFLLNEANADLATMQIAALRARAFDGTSIAFDRVFVDASDVFDPAVGRDVDLFSTALSTVTLTNAQMTSGNGHGLRTAATNFGVVNLGYLTIADYGSGTGAELKTDTNAGIYLENSILYLNATDLVTAGVGVQQSGVFAGIDPLFVDPLAGDYRILPLSPAVDASAGGATTGRFTDLDHRPRWAGAAPDCGAYETGAGLFADDFEVGDAKRWSASVP